MTNENGMKKLTAADPETKSADILAGNVARLRELFPEAFTEGKVDFEVLKQVLGGAVDEREEKFGLNWHGKRQARQLALSPSTGTLRPCPEESVDWDTTQNLMIEGDNLEVLKLLQKSYAGKVKLIYIDPPYNTGKDFVYPDNFKDSIANYLEVTGQTENGTRLSSNSDASGRYHTDWLCMMYPRLRLARNLLRQDGTLFVSIDDGEIGRLREICDEVFGEECFVACFVWEKRTNRENRKTISMRHDYVLCYCRNIEQLGSAISQLAMSAEALARYRNPDNDPRGAWKSDPAHAQAGHATKGQFYVLSAPNGLQHELPSGRCWLYTQEVMEKAIHEGRIWFGQDGNGVPRIKTYLDAKERGLTPESIWFAADASTNEGAKTALKELFGGTAVFDTPKPVELIEMILRIAAPDGIVLGFFAGTGTTGHAVYAQNSVDSANRRFILVQIPEPLDYEGNEQSVAAGFCVQHGLPRTLAEITKERLRLAGKKVGSDTPLFKGDNGFRSFKLASSNIRAWAPDRADIPKSLEESIDHLKTNRTETDILYELLLKLGLDLCVPIQTKQIAGKDVHSIGGGVLLTCLAEKVAKDEVEALALGIVEWHKALKPVGDVTCVFRDSAFADDVAKTNLAAILKQNGLENVRSL